MTDYKETDFSWAGIAPNQLNGFVITGEVVEDVDFGGKELELRSHIDKKRHCYIGICLGMAHSFPPDRDGFEKGDEVTVFGHIDTDIAGYHLLVADEITLNDKEDL